MAARSFVTIGLVGPDRSGAIAAVTQQLFRLGANIESLEEQVARGKFRMTLLASWAGAKLEERRIRAELEALAQHLRMKLTLRLADASRARRRLAVLVSKNPCGRIDSAGVEIASAGSRNSPFSRKSSSAPIPCPSLSTALRPDRLSGSSESRGLPPVPS